MLSKDGATINPLLEQFSRLKALAFDNVKQDLIVSDTNQENDTIYSIGTHESSNKTFIIDDVADNILVSSRKVCSRRSSQIIRINLATVVAINYTLIKEYTIREAFRR